MYSHVEKVASQINGGEKATNSIKDIVRAPVTELVDEAMQLATNCSSCVLSPGQICRVSDII